MYRLKLIIIFILVALSVDAQVIHLPLNGNLEDVSGNGHHAILEGGQESYEPSGRCGADLALKLDRDGGYDFMSVPTVKKYYFGNKITISYWVRPYERDDFTSSKILTNCTGESSVMATRGFSLSAKGTAFQTGYRFINPNIGCGSNYNTASVFMIMKLEDGTVISTTSSSIVEKAQLYHVCFVYGNGQALLYINGEMVSNQQKVGIANLGRLSADLMIGANSSNQSSPNTRSSFGDLKLYDEALSEIEVRAMYKSNLLPEKPIASIQGETNRVNNPLGLLLFVDNASASLNYTWQANGHEQSVSGNTLIAPLPNAYTVTGTNSDGCSNTSDPVYVLDRVGCVGDSRLADSLVLASFYESMNGATWINKTGWLTEQPLDEWHGIELKNDRVSKIEMPYNNLNGTIPESLGCLSKLEVLDLYYNNLTGNNATFSRLNQLSSMSIGNNPSLRTVPEGLASTALTDVNIRNIGISEIPAHMITGINPVHLDASLNQIHTLPEEIGNWNNLKSFNVSSNQITELPSSLNQLTDLESFDISNNQIKNIEYTFSDAPRLTNWDISKNDIYNLPDGLFLGLSSMNSVQMDRNQITDLPSTLSSISINNLNLAFNKLTFSDLMPFASELNSNPNFDFTYSPQAKVDTYEFFKTEECGPFPLLEAKEDAGLSGNSYVWYTKIQYGYGGVLIDNQTSNTLQTDENGYYYYWLRNTNFPELILLSEDKIVNGPGSGTGILLRTK